MLHEVAFSSSHLQQEVTTWNYFSVKVFSSVSFYYFFLNTPFCILIHNLDYVLE